METDISTGITRILNEEHAMDLDNSAQSVLSYFTEGHADVWISESGNDDAEIHILRFNLSSGKCEKDTIVRGINKKLNLRLVDRSFAVNPNMVNIQ